MKKSILLLTAFLTTMAHAQQIALNFAGDNDWVTGTNNSLPQGNNPRTIETWIKYSTGRNDMSIFNYGTFASNQKFTLHLYNGVYIIGEGNDLATGYNFNDGNWHHLAVTHNGTTTIVYVDGVIRGSKNTTYNTTGYAYQMGVSLRNGNWDFRFEGTIDELRVWNVARTQQQIIDNKNINFNAAPGLIASYHFNDGIANGNNTAVTTVVDASGLGNNGTLNNFTMNGTSSNFVSDAILLPLRLTAFTARPLNNAVLLNWKTAGEFNMASFVIESSRDGLNFAAAKEVTANNTSGENTYSTTVPIQSGKTYYRLRMNDVAGKATYSEVVSVTSTGNVAGIALWPNPASSQLTVFNAKAGAQYRIYNNAGILVQTAKLNGEMQLIDISKLKAGVYLMEVAGSAPVRFMKE